MTIIVAKKFKDRIEIASDSQTTAWNFYWRSEPKIEKIGNLIIWFSWSLTDIKILKNIFKDWADFNSLRELDIILDWFNGKSLNLAMIIIKDSIIYEVNFDNNWRYYSYIREDFSFIGSGYREATIASEFTDDLNKIIKVVCKHNTECSGKIIKKTIKI